MKVIAKTMKMTLTPLLNNSLRKAMLGVEVEAEMQGEEKQEVGLNKIKLPIEEIEEIKGVEEDKPIAKSPTMIIWMGIMKRMKMDFKV